MSEVSRRNFLKAAIPGAWALELKSGYGLGGLSTPAKIGLVKDAVLLTGGITLLAQERVPKSFKERVTLFDWNKVKGNELGEFTNDAADEYLKLTKTNRVTKQELIATRFLGSTAEFVNAAKTMGPDFTLSDRTWGMTNYSTREISIDMTKLKEVFFPLTPKGIDPNKSAGRAILQALWHEWSRLDITERRAGQFINKPQYFFNSPYSGSREVFRKYRGGAIYTDSYFGYTRFESVWNNTIVARRMMEQVDLDWVFVAGDYYQNGTDFFVDFTNAVKIPLEMLYQMHATSDFEGFMGLVGQKLPGNEPALVKGERLFTAIHKNDRKLIEQTGVLTLLSNKSR